MHLPWGDYKDNTQSMEKQTKSHQSNSQIEKQNSLSMEKAQKASGYSRSNPLSKPSEQRDGNVFNEFKHTQTNAQVLIFKGVSLKIGADGTF